MKVHAGRAAVWMAACAAVAMSGCGGKETESVIASSSDPKLLSVVAFAESETQSCSIPGGAVAILENGTLTAYAGFGNKDDSGGLATADTLFLTAGISKAMVGAAALALVEKGKLSLDHDVTDYVPLTLSTGVSTHGITMQALLTHTSGLPDLDTGNLSCATGAGALDTWFADNSDVPLWTSPGQVWDFSQRGYAVAGWVIGEATGGTFEDAMSSLVFAPAGMSTATYEPSAVLAGDHAIGHYINDKGKITEYQPGAYDCAASRPADGIYASVKDDAHFVEALYARGETMLSSASVTTLETGQILDELYPGEKDAYGLYAHDGYKGLHLVRTSGDVQGYQSAIWMVPASRFAVVVLFNGDNHADACSASDVAANAVDTYLGLANVASPVWTTDPSTWQSLLGTFVDPYVLGTIDVTLSGSSLVVTTDTYGTVTLTQQSATAFIGVFGDNLETVTFDPDGDDPAGWFVSRLGVGKRQP